MNRYLSIVAVLILFPAMILSSNLLEDTNNGIYTITTYMCHDSNGLLVDMFTVGSIETADDWAVEIRYKTKFSITDSDGEEHFLHISTAYYYVDYWEDGYPHFVDEYTWYWFIEQDEVDAFWEEHTE